MKIGIDGRLRNESGVGRYIQNLVRRLSKIDNKNEYILFSKKEDIADWKIKNNNWKIKVLNYHWHSLKEQLFAPFIILKENCDLIHFPYFNAPIFYPKKFVITIHDLTIDHFPTGRASTFNPNVYYIKRLGYKIDMTLSVFKASQIIVPSHATYSELLKHYPKSRGKTSIIYEGVEPKIRKENELTIISTHGLKPKKYFLYVGNAYPHKNLEKLVRAFQKLKIKNEKLKITDKNLKLILVGKDDFFYKRLKERVKELNLQGETIFTGEVTDEERDWLYWNALALIFPSLMEGFGLPALEAMSSHCLVLASSIPSLKEICQDCALYFDPQDESELTELMRKTAAGQVNLKEKIKCGRDRAKEFSWAKMARQTLKIYEDSVDL